MTVTFKIRMGEHEMNSISPDQLGLQEHVVLANSTPSVSAEHMNRRHSRICILAGVIAFVGVGCLLAGVVLIALSQSERSPTTKSKTDLDLNQTRSCDNNSTTSNNESKPSNLCEFSVEAERAGKPVNYRC